MRACTRCSYTGGTSGSQRSHGIVQVLTLVLLSFAMQSDSAFYKKGLEGIQKRMPLFVSEVNCILCLRVDEILYSAQIATPSSPKISLSCLSRSRSSSISKNTSSLPARV